MKVPAADRRVDQVSEGRVPSRSASRLFPQSGPGRFSNDDEPNDIVRLTLTYSVMTSTQP
jgi:hypothetical protein